MAKPTGALKEQLHTGQPHLFLGVNALVLDDATYFHGARVLLENNDEPNLVERRHDLKQWIGQTIRIGFSGGQMRMDYLKTLPGR